VAADGKVDANEVDADEADAIEADATETDVVQSTNAATAATLTGADRPANSSHRASPTQLDSPVTTGVSGSRSAADGDMEQHYVGRLTSTYRGKAACE
jgi:hypothetical protein